MNTNRIYVCSDNIEGIFTAIYDIYTHVSEHKTTHDSCKIITGEIGNFELFSEYIDVITDKDKALKVTRTVCERFGFEAYESFLYAASCDANNKATAIYKSIVTGFKTKAGFRLINMWTDANVSYVLELSRKAKNEFASWREFLQFHELNNGVLFSRIGPTCDIIMFLATHFENRFPNENFMIYDDIRDKYLVHEKGKKCVIVIGNGIDPAEETAYSKNDSFYDELFNVFTHTIAIKERKNLKLQQNLMPLRIQKYKIEF
ncbi:MAG: TIGR03915 family putative DNA repair protein [Lachnospiraceae bacterium]|nr:TIGR03915 family putative DNA repair protein [Lachnospiraceae bacterium]